MQGIVAFAKRPHWDPPDPSWVVRRWPDLTGYCFATFFFWLSLTPSLLPRPWVLQGLIGGVTGIAGYALGSLISTVVRAVAPPQFSERVRTLAWRIVPSVLLVATVWLVVWGARAQRRLRVLQGVGESSTWNGAIIIGISLGTFLVLLVLCRAVRLLTRKLVTWFARMVPRPWSYVLGVSVCAMLVAACTKDVLWDRGFIGFVDHVSQHVNDGTEQGIQAPTSPWVSGSPASLVSWQSLGTKGRTFVATAPTRAELQSFSSRQATDPIRVYVGEHPEESDFTAAAQLALREMDRTDAWDRKVINLVGTTGSGWVDRNIPTPLEYMYNGDTATVALQYSYLPSWISFLVDQERAGHASRALYHAVRERLLTIPENHRPKLVVSGESLGAFATDAIFDSPQSLINGTDAALFEGPPQASTVWQKILAGRDPGTPVWQPEYQQGRSVRFAQWPNPDLSYPLNAPWTHPRVVYLQNASDPVVWWTPPPPPPQTPLGRPTPGPGHHPPTPLLPDRRLLADHSRPGSLLRHAGPPRPQLRHRPLPRLGRRPPTPRLATNRHRTSGEPDGRDQPEMELRHPDAPEPASAPRHDPAPDPLPAPDAAGPKPASGVKLAAASNADRPDRSPAAAAPNRAPDSAAANPNPTAGTSNPASPNPDHAPAASNRAPDPPATDHDPSAAAANPGPAADPPTAVPPTPVRNPTGLTTRLTTHLHRPIPNGQALILAILLLAAVNYALHRVQWVENLPELATSLAMTALFVALAWWSGHASEELGLDRKSWPLGLKWSGIIVVGVALVYLAAAVFPGTRGLFTDARYASLSASQVAVRVFIDVPFATVLAEEVAFRGVLFGLALRRWKPLWATVFSSLMFGLWHILSSLHLNTEKPALTSIVGRSTFGATLADIGTVVFTGLGGAVFCELRRRSGSLLVPMSFHWATNALGYVFGFLLRIGAIAQLG